MNISLRKARKFESRICSRIKQGPKLRHSLPVFGNDDPTYFLQSSREITKKSITDFAGLVRARSEIRRAIQQKNEEVGINQAISKRKEWLELLSVWNQVKHVCDEVEQLPTPELLANTRENQSKSTGSMYSRNQEVEVVTVDAEMSTLTTKKIRQIRRDIDIVEDQLSRLNFETKIELDQDTVEFLTEMEIS